MSKKDDISRLYKPSTILEKIRFGLFCANTFFLLIAACVDDNINSYITIVLVVIAFLYMSVSVIDDGMVWFQAERARRKNSIQVAFNVRLDKHNTLEYYNNNVSNPDIAYAVNQFESVFFTKEISERMFWRAVVKILVVAIILIIFFRVITDNSVLLIVAQTVFSTIVIEDAIRMIIFTQRIKVLFEEAYHELITVGISKSSQRIWLKYFCVEYESLKAHYRIRLSESLFHKLNPMLSEESKEICKQIKM